MAVLSDTDRAEGTAFFNNSVYINNIGEIVGLTKTDVRAAFDALDSFLETNQNAVNQAIPEPARTNLTTAQKAWLLQLVVERRYRSV